MERIAIALNPAQGIVAGKRLIDLVREQGQLDAVLDALDADLDQREHALYEVRRILRPRKTDPTKLGNAARSVRIRGRGSRGAMDDLLRRLPACAEACPTQALTFGNLVDETSVPAQTRKSGRNYILLAELYTEPGVNYLGRASFHVTQHGVEHLGTGEAAHGETQPAPHGAGGH